jgi:hypothetical protein
MTRASGLREANCNSIVFKLIVLSAGVFLRQLTTQKLF